MHHPCLGADAEYESAQFPDRRPVFSPRFAAIYHRLRTLPRRVRKALQRRYKAPLVGVALLLATQPLTGEAANFTAGTAEEFVSAVNAANSTDEADTITLTADITLSEPIRGPTPYGRSGILVSSTLTIAGKGHTLRREPRNTEQFRLLAVTASGNLTLQDTTLSGGYSAGQTGGYSTGWGGAIFTKGQLTLEGCTISGNTAVGRGGGILGGRQITNSTISGNTAGRDGGGVFDSFGTLVLANSTISGNTAGEDGGGVGNVGDITNSTVRDNIAGGYGGGIAGVGKLTDSLVSGNIARAKGGGVFAVGALVNSTISGNTATGSGGGVFLITGPDRTVELTNSTISGNTANGNGGGVYSSLFGATATLINNTISGNTADGNGGGVFLNPGP